MACSRRSLKLLIIIPTRWCSRPLNIEKNCYIFSMIDTLRPLSLTLVLCLFTCESALFAQPPRSMDGAELGIALKKLTVLGSVLYIAAHPDDESSALLAYFAKGRMYRSAYLSLT